MKRKIEVIIKDTCQGCPYCRFVDHSQDPVDHPQDPTYECFHPNIGGVSFGYLSVSIADRWTISHPNNDRMA